MQFKVLVIGPKDLKDLIMFVSKEYPELQLDYATYHNNNEIIDIVKHDEKNYDVLLFAGSLPYTITKNQLKLNKRMVYIEFKGTSLYRILFQLIREEKKELFNGTLNMSIDHLEKFAVKECFEELNIHMNHIFYYENNLEKDIEHLVSFHHDLWLNEQIDVAVTCIGSVYEKLTELGVPTTRIIPTRSSIRNSLDKVLTAGVSLRQLNSQIATGIIKWKSMDPDHHLTKYQLQRRVLEMKHILVDYGEKTQSIITWIDQHQVKFITTRGALHFEDSQSNEIKLLEEIYSKTNIRPHMGIGIGMSTNEAEKHAREALEKSPDNKSAFYVVDIDRVVHGPVGVETHLSYSTRSDSQKIMDIAKQVNLSSSTINRVLSFCNVQGNEFVTTADLSSGLGIAIRSARRILNKLETVNLATVTGEEQPINRGRPRKVYSLRRLHEMVAS